MVVNKDRVKAFKDATKGDARQGFLSGNPSKYSFDYFCREHGLYKHGREIRSGGVVITCPFHRDDAPSCSMNDELGVFNCFSCGGGSYWKFVHRYHTEVLGESIGMYQLMNSYLQKDPALMATLGFSSIFDKKDRDSGVVGNVQKFRFKRDDGIPKTYLELQEKFMKRDPSLEEIKNFILLMQSEVPVDIAWKELMGKGKKKKQYDLEELNSF